MSTAQETRKRKEVPVENSVALFENANKATQARARKEVEELDKNIRQRQALLEAMKPEQRDRLVEQLKSQARVGPIDGMVGPRPDRVQLPPATCISYQVMRPPFTTNWLAAPNRLGVPFQLTTPCVNVFTNQSLGLTAVSGEGILSTGTLSVQAAIGEFFNASCQPINTSWFLGEANNVSAALIGYSDTGVALPSAGFISIGVDLEMEGQVGWSNFLFPGEPGSGLGMVGFIGIGGLYFQVGNGTQNVEVEDTERFLMGSASAYFPPDIDRKPSFTLSNTVFLNPTDGGTIDYQMAISADLTAFRSTPIEHGGYPGFAHANFTAPGTVGPLQPGTPLKVKEIRVAVCIWP